MWDAAHFALRAHNERSRDRRSSLQNFESVLLRPDPVHQFLLQSGITLFHQMKFEDLKRVQIDIQTLARDKRQSEATRKDDRIVVATVSTSDGEKHVFDGRSLDEPALLTALLGCLRELNPDVIEGHELFDRILPYLSLRLDLHGLEFRLGRDDSLVRKLSRQESDWSSYEVAGRHLVDTIPLLEAYDFVKKSLEQYRLPYLARHFNMAQDGRISMLESELCHLPVITGLSSYGTVSTKLIYHLRIGPVCRKGPMINSLHRQKSSSIGG